MRRALLIAALLSSPAAAQNNASVETLLIRLREAAQGSARSVRLYYRTPFCDHSVIREPVTVPMRRLRRQRDASASIRAMFAEVDRVQVREDESGVIRVTIDNPPVDLLQTRVSLQLDDSHRFSPLWAVAALESSSEMQAAVNRLGMEAPIWVTSGMFSRGPSGPHLPEQFRNVTADHYLDEVGKTFRVIVTYAVCPDGRFRIRTESRDPCVPISYPGRPVSTVAEAVAELSRRVRLPASRASCRAAAR
jgi:hypothetical protein